MQKIKFFNKDKKQLAKLNEVLYRGYTVGDLPTRFGFLYNEETEQEGINKWFKYKGLTYIEVKDSIWTQINRDNERINVEMLFNCMK